MQYGVMRIIKSTMTIYMTFILARITSRSTSRDLSRDLSTSRNFDVDNLERLD
jgi:hypothetical protein